MFLRLRSLDDIYKLCSSAEKKGIYPLLALCFQIREKKKHYYFPEQNDVGRYCEISN